MQPGAALFDCRDSLIDDSKGLILCRANPLPDFRQESSVFRRGGLRPFHGALRGHRLLPHPLRHAASPPTSIHTGRCAACGGFHPFVTGSPTPSCWWYYSRGGAQAHAEEAPPTVGSPCGFWGKVYCARTEPRVAGCFHTHRRTPPGGMWENGPGGGLRFRTQWVQSLVCATRKESDAHPTNGGFV